LNIQRVADYDEMSRRAAQHVRLALRRRPNLLLGTATGDSPRGMFELLAAARAARPQAFARLRVLILDEWRGLPKGHPATCEVYDRERITGPLGVPASRRQRWRGDAREPAAEIRRMTRWLAREGPIDLCILGLGRNGHLLMNEPAASLVPGPHLGRLAAQTRHHPTLRAARPTPRFGYGLGLADILSAREVLLLVSGQSKKEALRRTLQGRVDPRCPASFLWLHPNATVYCDREAAGTTG